MILTAPELTPRAPAARARYSTRRRTRLTTCLAVLFLACAGIVSVPALEPADFEETGLVPKIDVKDFAFYVGIGFENAYFAPPDTFDPQAIIDHTLSRLTAQYHGSTESSYFFGYSIYLMPLYFITDWFAVGGELVLHSPARGQAPFTVRFPLRAAVHFNIADAIQVTPLVGTTAIIADEDIGTTALFDVGLRIDFWKYVHVRANYLIGAKNALIFGFGGGLPLF